MHGPIQPDTTLEEFEKRAITFGGGVRWTPQSVEVCVEGSRTTGFASRERESSDKPLVTGRVLPPGRAKLRGG